MPTLKEILGGQQNAPQTGEGQRLQDLIKTKETGKASTPSSGPRASSLGEAAAVDTYKQQNQKLTDQANLQQQVIQQQNLEQQREVEQKNASLTSKADTLNQAFQQKVNEVLQGAKQSGQELTFKEDAEKLEQLGTALRLQDDKYVSNLELEGQRMRLDNENQFKLEMARTIFKDNIDILKDKIGMDMMYTEREIDFDKQLANMDMETALKIGKIEQKEQNERAKSQAVGKMIGGVGSLIGGMGGSGGGGGGSSTPSTGSSSMSGGGTGGGNVA